MAARTDGALGGTIGQVQNTESLQDTMRRPGLLHRALMALVASAERLNLTYARLGNPPVYDNADFPWAGEIEREWHLLRPPIA